MTRFAAIENPNTGMNRAFFRILLLLALSAFGAAPLFANAPAEFTLYGSRYPMETVSDDDITINITVHSDSHVAAGTYTFDFGVILSSHTLVVDSGGTFDASSGGTISADGYSITFSHTFSEFLEDWDWHVTGSHSVYMGTISYTMTLTPGTFGGTAIWSQPIDLNDYWYWDYAGSWAQGWLADTYEVRPPVHSNQPYSINLPGMQTQPKPDPSPIPSPPNTTMPSESVGPGTSTPGGRVAPATPPGTSPASPELCPGMASYTFDQLRAGLIVNDTPLFYQPPVGSGIAFTTTYNQRDIGQLLGLPVAGLGPLWTYNALTYIIGAPQGVGGTVSRFVPGGGIETYSGFQVSSITYNSIQTELSGSYAPEQYSQAVLSWDAVNQAYTRTLPNGAYEVYNYKVLDDGGNAYFLISSQTDAQGNVITYSYDSQNRLTAITDALGQSTTFSYGNSNPLLITQVTDPFGRAVKFTYDSSGRLQSATDPVGIVSVYAYDSTNFLDSLTTPYGTTTFSTDSDSNHQGVQATNPLGQTERVELRYNNPSGVSDTDTVPSASGILANGASGLSYNNTYYWNRRQYTSTLNYANAQITHWMTGPRGLTNMVDSQKQPLEGRVWYTYQGQSAPDVVDDSVQNLPTVTARIMDSSATQASYASYNDQGMVTQSIDAVGRTTNYNYAANGIDLLQIARVNGSGQDTLGIYTYDSLHLPLTYTDASGQVTRMTYNGQGQLLTSTDAKGEITTLAYDDNGYLTSVTGPVSGATTSYTYDSAGRVHTITDSEGYEVTLAYDDLNRVTSVTYPDSTSDLTSYKFLDVAQTTDRQGRVTTQQYDAIREPILTTDPLGRTTKYTWCTCGGLATLTDPNGNVTTWNHDLEGRVTSKVFADSSTITFGFETTTSRLHSVTDAIGSSSTYAYNLDNTISGVTYSAASGVSTTSNVSYNYDSVYNRLTSMVDGTGTTSYTYNPITGSTTTGAGQLASISVPIASSAATVTYAYDELGRVTGRDVDHATTGANDTSTTYDTLGRVTGITNALGAFTYGYVDTTSRLSSVTYPSGTGMSTSYSYFGNTGDQRLETLQNLKGGTTNLSKFDYTYNACGTIATWTQQADSSTAVDNTLSYDSADQLTDAVQSGGGSASNAYHYDPAGNRLAEVTGSGTTGGQFNNLNQLTGLSGSPTSQTVAGHTSAAVTGVTIDAVPASISNSTNFTASVPLLSGTNVVSVVATPPSGSVTTQRYQIVNSGTAPALTYDGNGNMHEDQNGNTYKWDVLNRLTAIVYSGGTHTEFAYDGLGRRVQIVERAGTTIGSGTISSTKNYLWTGSQMVEERDASNNVTKRFFSQGEQQISGGTATPYYYTRDHLGSVRELCSSTGSTVARYSYDPYGRTTLVSGSNLATLQYAGMYVHQNSGLSLTQYRAYDSNTGRWLSRDPLGENGGINLYGYVGNGPINRIDPLGLTWADDASMTASWAAGTAPPSQGYGPSTNQTQDMMNAPGVQSAINYYDNKNANSSPGNQQAVTDYDASFGLSGLWNAGTNSTQQFVGSYSVNIYPNSNGTISVQVFNTTSMTSLLYGLYPNALNPPNGWPMGNASQMYYWTQRDPKAGGCGGNGGSTGGAGGSW